MRFTRNRSHIWAIPQGADHARQYTATDYFSDEMAYQIECEDVLAAVGPSLSKKGNFIGVSSAAPGEFEELVFDRADPNAIRA